MKEKIIEIIRCYSKFDGKTYSFPRMVSETIAYEIVALFNEVVRKECEIAVKETIEEWVNIELFERIKE